MYPEPTPGVTLRKMLAVCLVAAVGALSAPSIASAAPAPSEAQLILNDRSTQRVLTAVASSPVPAAASSYVVRPGDTLSAIAARFCGSAGAFPSLAAASGIRNPDLIYPGRVVTLTCSGARAAAAYSPPPTKAKSAAPAPASSAAGRVVAFALAQVGKPYVWAAAGPRAFDCSGLVMAAYATVGVRLPHQSESLLGYGRTVSRSQLQPGDVIWPYHGHVMIYIGDGKIVEAANPRQGVRVSTIYSFMTARRYS